MVSILPLVASLLAGVTLTLALRQRHAPPGAALVFTSIALMVWTLGQLCDQLLSPWPFPRFWVLVQYLGIAFAPWGWLFFALRYAGYDSRLTRPAERGLVWLPVLTCIAVWSNGLHGLFWPLGPGAPRFGPWFWVHTALSYAALFAGTLVLARQAYRTPGPQRRSAVTLVLSALTPWVVNIAYISGLITPSVDPTPAALSLGIFLLAWSVLKFRVLNLVPVAREWIVDAMPDAVLVLDAHNRVADMNPAARHLLGVEMPALGQAATVALERWPELIADLASGSPTGIRTVRRGDRIFEVSCNLLMRRGQQIGTLLVWHDVSERVAAEAREHAFARQAQRQARNLELIDQVRVAIADERTLSQLYTTVVEWIAGSFGYRFVSLYLIDENDLVLQHQVGYTDAVVRQSVEAGIMGRVVRDGEAVLVTDARLQDTFVYAEASITAEVAVPLYAGESVVGVLNVESDGTPPLDEEAMRILQILGHSVSEALQRVRLDEDVRASEERYRTVVASLSAGVVVLAEDGTCATWNASAETILGRSGAQLREVGLFDRSWRLLNDDGSVLDANRTATALMRHTGREFRSQVLGMERPEGTRTWVSMSARPLEPTRAARSGATVVSFVDITERRRAEEELRYQRAMLACLTESSLDGILVVGEDNAWRMVNRRLIEQWSLPPAMVSNGTTASALTHVLPLLIDADGFRATVNRMYTDPSAQAHDLVALRDGRVFECYTAPVRSEEGVFYGRAWFYRDVTARVLADAALREAKAALEQQVAELDAFAHTVAHNIKTPLTAIVSASYMLDLQTTDVNPETRELAQMISDGSMKLNAIVDALLLLASTASSREVPSLPLVMEQVVNAIPQRLNSLIKQREARLVIATAWPAARGYGPWVEEVWANYVSNAIQYSGERPLVTLGADPARDGLVRFWVRDEGPGLSAAQQARLFTPFTRLHLERAPGHGLGLAIVQRIVSRLGGTVGVESVPGTGSTFYFTLPAEVPSSAEAPSHLDVNSA